MTNMYRLLYLKSPRQWIWLSLSIQIPCSSGYWAPVKTTQAEYRKWQTPTLCGAALLPSSLTTKIQDIVCQSADIRDNSRLFLSLSDNDTVQQKSRTARHNTYSANPALSNPSLDALNSLDDLGCPWYFEEQVVQIEMVDPPNCFASVNGTLVYEIKSRDSSPDVEFLYSIEVLHCMGGVHGFAKLVGIVTDKSRTCLKSYLIEFPRAQWNVLQLAGLPSVPWERREKWALQLVHGLSQMHSKNFVAGGLTLYSITLVLDSTDSLLFWSFKKRLIIGRKTGAYYPPELRRYRDASPTTSAAKCPYVTSKMDIFHLGLLLWLLAENKPITRPSPPCMREGCETGNETFHDPYHAEPVALPELSDSIPQYYRDVVQACRAEQPSDRPAARELLKMFPNVCKVQQQHELRQPYSPDMSDFGGGFRIGRVTCSVCGGRPLQLPMFHCNVCCFGDFDLCQTCYGDGAHCGDDNHLLVELGRVEACISPLKYYSCVKSTGIREIFDP